MALENDPNDGALHRMRASGDDLTRPRNVDFTVVFPNQHAADQFAKHFRALGYVVSVELAETEESLPWDVTVVRHMALSSQAIADFEHELEDVASSFAGRNDGWGCYSQR